MAYLIYALDMNCIKSFYVEGGTKTTVAILMRDILRCLGHQNHHAACYLDKVIIHKSIGELFLWNKI